MTKSSPSKSTRENRRKQAAAAFAKRGLRVTRYTEEEEDRGWVSFIDARLNDAALRRHNNTYGNTPRMMVEVIDDHDDYCDMNNGECLMWEFDTPYTFRGTDLDDPEITVR